MRHYYSIANFLAGMGTKIYDNYFSSYNNQTYQQLFGQFTVIAKGQVGANVAQGILPQNLINQWGNDLAQTIATEWLHCVANMENSPEWNGDASPMIHTSLFNFMSEWSTVTTIAAGVIDGISQQIRDATSILELERIVPVIGIEACLVALGATANENVVVGGASIVVALALTAISLLLSNQFLGVEKINLMYQVGFDFSKLDSYYIRNLVKELGLESLKPLKDAGFDFSELGSNDIRNLVKELGLESIKPLKDAGFDFSKLYSWEIKELVEKYGLESIKPLKDAGFDFSKLDSYDIRNLVKELGIESLKPLKDAGFDFSKLYSWEIKELVEKYGLEITEFYKIIDDKSIFHDIIEYHINDIMVEQDTISVIIKEVEVNNLQGIVTELNPSSWGEDFAITT